MQQDFKDSDAHRWLQHLQTLETRNPHSAPPNREEYLALLKELGYTDHAIENIEALANQRLVKAQGYFDANAYHRALEEFLAGYELMPWRRDLIPILADLHTRMFAQDLSRTHLLMAHKFINQWIQANPDDTASYQMLKQLNRHAQRRQRRLIGFVLAAAAVILGSWLMIAPPLDPAPGDLIDNTPHASTPKQTPARSKAEPARAQTSPPPVEVAQGNLSVTQPSARNIGNQSTPGDYGLIVTASHSRPIPSLHLDASESTLSIKPYVQRRHGRLKLRVALNKTAASKPDFGNITELKALVEWMTPSHEVADAKQLTMIHPDTKLYLGETLAVHQSNFDLPSSALYAKITITHMVTGTAATRPKGTTACIEDGLGIPPHVKLAVNAHPLPRGAIVQKSLFSIKNLGDDVSTLYAYPRYYDQHNRLIERASKRTLLTRKTISSSLTPILLGGEERLIRIANILNPEDRRAIHRVCLEFSQNEQPL